MDCRARNCDLGREARQKKAKSTWLFSTQVTLLLACELVTTTRNKCYKGGDRSELAIAKSRAYEQERSLSVGTIKKSLLVRDFLMVSTGRTSDPLGVGARIKIAPVEQFLTQVTLLLACELVTTTRNKRY